MNPLLKFLMDNHGWKNKDATQADLLAEANRLVKADKLTLEKFIELTKAPSDPMDRLAGIVGTAISAAVSPLAKRLEQLETADDDRLAPTRVNRTADEIARRALESSSTKARRASGALDADDDTDPTEIMVGGDKGGRVDVKRASDWYDGTSKAAVFPDGHYKAGAPITLEGRQLSYPSQKEQAWCGAHLKWNIARQVGMVHMLSDHDRDLLLEGARKARWAGDLPRVGGGMYEYHGEHLLDEHVKTIFADGTSGGSNLIQQILEDQIVMSLLLHGEILPYVDMKTLPKGNAVDTTTLTHMTVSSGPEEASSAITPQSTTSLISKVSSSVFTATGAIELGRDFLSDATPQVMPQIQDSYNQQLKVWLDNQICNGDGTTEPLGLFVISGPTSVSSLNGSTGSFAVIDFENMMRALGKPYRANKGPSVRWVSNDTTYWRARGVPVDSTDARRIFGQDYESYSFAGRPWSVQNDVGNTKVGFGDLSKYRLWNRPGMEMQVEQSGRTLVLANTILVVLRSRWAGRLIDPSAFVKMTTAPR